MLAITETADTSALSRREARIAELLALGLSEKQVACSLGVSPSTVSRSVRSALHKLGLRSRVQLAGWFARHAQATRARPAVALGRLTPAEREVAWLAGLGSTDAEIANQRGASQRTVENQLQQIYRKLSVHSRTELAVQLSAS